MTFKPTETHAVLCVMSFAACLPAFLSHKTVISNENNNKNNEKGYAMTYTR